MIIWDILHTIFDLTSKIILGAGPFFFFKGMGTGSQSGKLLFKTISDGKNFCNIESGPYEQKAIICMRDQMVWDAQKIDNNFVAVGTGTSICSSYHLQVNCMPVWQRRGINVPIIGARLDCAITNQFGDGINKSNSLIINGRGNIIYSSRYTNLFTKEFFSSKYNSIINSYNSCVGEAGKEEGLTLESSQTTKFSSIISSGASRLLGYTSYSTIISGCYNVINRSQQSTIIGGCCNCLKDNYYKYSKQSYRNFIGGGSCNLIHNSSILTSYQDDPPPRPYNRSVGNSIVNGCCNTICGGFYGTVLSGCKNTIEVRSIYGGVCDTHNLIGTGNLNKISSYNKLKKTEDCGSYQSILSGSKNVIRNSSFSSIINGYQNYIDAYKASDYGTFTSNVILSGRQNELIKTRGSVILNGYKNKTEPKAGLNDLNVILNGQCNEFYSSYGITIVNGSCNKTISSKFSTNSGYKSFIENSFFSTILGGFKTKVSVSKYSTILQSVESCIACGIGNTIIGGYKNFLYGPPGTQFLYFSSVLSGYSNHISLLGNGVNTKSPLPKKYLSYGFITGGRNNCICLTMTQSIGSGIIGGCKNLIQRSSLSTIFGGCGNRLGTSSTFFEFNSVYNSSIIGGCQNSIPFNSIASNVKDFKSYNNVIIGGCSNQICNTATICNNVIVGGSGLVGYTTKLTGLADSQCNLVQSEKLSLRGNMYVTNQFGAKCKGLSSVTLNATKLITSICVVKGIIITMSYA